MEKKEFFGYQKTTIYLKLLVSTRLIFPLDTDIGRLHGDSTLKYTAVIKSKLSASSTGMAKSRFTHFVFIIRNE